VRASALCSLCVFSLASLPLTAFGDAPERAEVQVSGGVSIAGASYRGVDLSGPGPYAAVELRASDECTLEVDYRRHDLSALEPDADTAETAQMRSRLVSIILRHSLFTLRGNRYVDLYAGLGSERIEPEGEPARSRRTLRFGVTLMQPGSMYHVSDHLELRFGIGVLVARAWTGPAPAGCTGPCSSATSGRSTDFGYLGTFAIGFR
jgi:hypothetical protein